MIGTNSFTLSNSLSGMILICLSIAQTNFLGDVCLIMNFEVSYRFVMTRHVGGILVERKQQLKSSNVGFIGQLCFATLSSIVNSVGGVSSWEKLVEGT
jgi:hypothetical protein